MTTKVMNILQLSTKIIDIYCKSDQYFILMSTKMIDIYYRSDHYFIIVYLNDLIYYKIDQYL